MARRHVALFEFPVLPGVAPLASGYLEAVAGLAEGVRDKHDFTKHVFSLAKDGIIEAVLDVEAHVYGFSCYVWNSKLVRRILPELFARHPTAHVILGGPQVMHKAELYLDPTRENLVLCNGEGEFTFVQYLEQLIAELPDMSKVKGLSFYRNGELVTTEKQTRIRDLNEIPSPYLEGYVDPSHYNLAVFERIGVAHSGARIVIGAGIQTPKFISFLLIVFSTKSHGCAKIVSRSSYSPMPTLAYWSVTSISRDIWPNVSVRQAFR